MALLETLRYLVHPGRDADYGARGRSEWLDIDWSSHIRSLTVQEAEIEYVELGSGPPILWIHGLGANWQSWLENLPEFAHRHRCVAVDLPGFGRSPLPPWEISIEAYARVLAGLCETLGVERATVVGNSMGGFVGAEMAIRYAERVERLVLVSAAVFWQEYRRAKPLLALARLGEAASAEALASAMPHLVRRPRLRAAALGSAGFRYPHLLPRELQVELLLTAGERTPGFYPALKGLAGFPLRDELPKIACPTLVVWGEHDTLVSVKHAHELERLIPSAEKVIFERTGHEPMLERPERFNRVMADWMGRTGEAAEAPRTATAR